jgi:hypothetical protein
VFEYLLQAHLFPSKLTVGDVDTIVEQIHRSRSFLSLWGAVRVALQMYFDEQSPENAPVLTELSIMADSQIRAMMIDMLTEYGLDQREKVQTYLLETLLPLKSEEAGQIVVQVAYELALVDALEECLVHLSRLVKQLATQNVFYLWQQIPDKGAIIVTRLYERIEAQWRNILASVLGNFLQGARGVEMITGLVPFLDLFALFIGYAYMAGPEIQPIGKVLGKFIFLISSGPLAPFVKRFLQRWGEQIAVRIAQAAPIYGAKLLRVIFDYPTNHPLRKSIGDFAEYADPRVPIPQHVLDQMFDVAQEPVGTPMFVIASIFYPRGKDLDNVFSFCKRLFFEGNIYSKNLALRIASLIVYMEELGGEYVEFVEQMLLELWNGQEATYRYPIKEDADSPVIEVDIPVGNLHAPVLYECRTKTGGASEFIEKILQLPWHGDPSQRIIRVLECLEDVILLAGATKRTSIRPVLETLRRDEWMGHEDPAVRTALVDLLSYARSFHPTEVDQFLDSLLTEPGNGYESSDKPSTQLVRDVYERFKLRPLSELFVGSFLVGVPWLQQNSELFRSLISTQVYRESALGEHIDWDDVMATLGRGVGSFEMLEEITGLLSTKL